MICKVCSLIPAIQAVPENAPPELHLYVFYLGLTLK